MANTYKALQTVTVGVGGVASISFTSIPQNYTDLKIVLSARTVGYSAPQDYAKITFNSDTTNSYFMRYLLGSGSGGVGSSTSGSVNYPGGSVYSLFTGDTSTSNTFGNSEIYILNYANNNQKTISADMVSETNATDVQMFMRSGTYYTTTGISNINIAPYYGTSFAQYSTFTLYGLFNADVSAAPSTPTIGTASIGNLSASVAFTPVSNAASYTITSSPGGITATGTTSPIRIAGLTAGTAYTFTVVANNPIASSAASAASNSVTPTTAGVTWTTRTSAMPAASGWTRVLYSNGIFIAGIYDVANTTCISYDGITWTSRSLLTTGDGRYTGITYGFDKYFVSSRNGAGSGYGIQFSTDAVNWSYPSGSLANLSMYGIGFNGSAVCAAGDAGTTAQYSTTGTSGWTTSTLPSNQGWSNCIGGNGHFVAIQDGGGGPTTAAASSSNNGATWTARTMTSTAQRWRDGIYVSALGRFVFVSRTGGACYSDDNGASYTATTLPTGVYNFITYGGGFFIAAAWGNIATSPDGITWTLRTGPSGTSGGGEGITYGPNGAVVVQYGTANMGTAF
jgi:trimeric autotransporter adhesin